MSLAVLAVAAAACGGGATSGAHATGGTGSTQAPGTHAPVTSTGGTSAASSLTPGGSTIVETVGSYRFGMHIGASVVGSAAVVKAFAQHVVTRTLPRAAAAVLPPLPLQGSGRFVAFIVEVVNTGSEPEPSNAQGVVALGNGLPLVGVANPSVVGMTTAGPTGLRCPSEAAASATSFGPDNSKTLCVELVNAGSGPLASSTSQSPGEFAAGQSVLYVLALALPPTYSIGDLHIAVNTSSVGDEASWVDSVPVTGRPVTVVVDLPARFTAGEA